MAYGTMSIGGLGMKTNDDFIFDQDGTMKINKLTYYPVGSIYQSIDPTSPAELFGGTWESIASNRVLIGSGDKYAAESIGGEESVSLTANNNGPHIHEISAANDATGSLSVPANEWRLVYKDPGTSTNYLMISSRVGVHSSGSGTPFSIIQPYYAVYMWKRIE